MVSEAVKWKILVVDDDAEMRGLVARSIRLEVPCTTTEAGSAKEATSLLKVKKFHVVVSDLSMEDSGLDILRFLKNEHLNIPILFFTGTNVEFPSSESIPFFSFIEKPKFGELMNCLKSQLKGRKNENDRT